MAQTELHNLTPVMIWYALVVVVNHNQAIRVEYQSCWCNTCGNFDINRKCNRCKRNAFMTLICYFNVHSEADLYHNITYSFIANCQTAVVHKNKTKRRSKIYKSQYIFRYNILTVKLQSVIREMWSGSCLLWGLFLRL